MKRMNSTDDPPPTRHKAHDDIEFLASSWNRLDVLEALTDTPRTRDELKELTDVSRVTLSRILSDLEERGWITREAGQFEATTNGAVVASEVSGVLDTMVTANELGTALEWLPIDQFDFDLEHLRDMTIITPDHEDLNAPTQTLIDLVYQSTRIRAILTAINHEAIAALQDATATGDRSLEYILSPKAFDIVSNDPELQRQFMDMCDSGQAEVYHYPDDTPVTMLVIFDERVVICGHGDGDIPPGTIETTNDAIRSWAESYFDDRCAEARRLDADMFTP